MCVTRLALKMTGTIKCFIFFIVIYLITVCLVYNCIIELKYALEPPTSSIGALGSKTGAPKDLYRLQWNSKDKVFFKKVRPGKKEQSKNNISSKLELLNQKSNQYRLFFKVTKEFYVVSAFYDHRLPTHYVRIIATLNKFAANKDRYWCHFKISDPTEKHSSYVSSKLVSYEMCENHRRRVGGWILSCEVPKEVISKPSAFKIGISSIYQKNPTNTTIIPLFSANYLHISHNKSFENVHGGTQIPNISPNETFGICVPPLYGTIQSKALVEYIELSRLLGIHKIIFYVFEVQEEIQKILQYYKSLEYIDVIPWEIPFNWKSIWNYGQSLAVNDCLYRHMDGIDYLAFLDIDEILVPRKEELTWREMLLRMSQASPTEFESRCGFTFRSTFFDPEFSDVVKSNGASTVVRVNRTDRFSFFRNKVLVRPSRIFELGIHHVSRSWPDFKNYTVAQVDPSIAAVYHYRKCINEFGINCKGLVEDLTVPLKYGKELSANVISSMMKIMR